MRRTMTLLCLLLVSLAGLTRYAAFASEAPPTSLLDEVGLLAGPSKDADVTAWRAELPRPDTLPSRAAQLHIWIGEYLLAHDQMPELAIREFKSASSQAGANRADKGLGDYDAAMALFYEGAYSDAADAFQSLLNDKTGLTDFPRKSCALWQRHASACSSYHAERAWSAPRKLIQ